MFSHVTLGISDLDRALAFYRPLTAALELEEKFNTPDIGRFWAGYVTPGTDRPIFIVTQPWNEEAPAPGNGPMVAFAVGTRAQVDEIHALALALGGSNEGAPGLRLHYHADYYGAYFRDPDGNKLCVVCHAPATGEAAK
ncbi:VOC family protein [Sinisalibacter aestuarii]|uniref:VOC domain-containing protein n=1 Tax=Sinisalibacter aestuarii TaxID=2949426 RepID=A0ABQ5LYZ1_9RHOB|nr:VOC family protein [Sinisalibacter aestuarii]GKY90197.1 hypothetical protein STA1M1_40660 [Sinisalibacter aestuarii]